MTTVVVGSLTQVHSTSKKLLYQLDHLVQICSQLRRDGQMRSKHVRRGTTTTTTPKTEWEWEQGNSGARMIFSFYHWWC